MKKKKLKILMIDDRKIGIHELGSCESPSGEYCSSCSNRYDYMTICTYSMVGAEPIPVTKIEHKS